MKLNNKVALVTGGSQGLGESISKELASLGATVIALDMKPLQYEASNIIYYPLDVTDVKQVESMFSDITTQYGRIDILVNNAGITKDAMTRNMTEQDFDLVVNVNLKGVFNLVKLIGPYMEKQGFGSIINISSVVGLYGNIGQANYAATKAGVIGLTMTWAKEFARKGTPVRVNAVAPGYIMTDILKTVPQELLDQFAQMTMLKRLGKPIEIAKTVAFLASDDASYITGQTISVNGGMRL